MKKQILFIILFLISGSVLMSQIKTDAMLFGDVKSKKTGEHIPYANILIKGTKTGTTCDGSGHYKLAHLPLGKHIVIAQAMGYKNKEKEVVFEAGKAVSLFFDLEEDVHNLEQVVVTGTRTNHLVKDVPVRTEIITNKNIENKNACNIYQALEGTPGIRVENQCQSCNFTMVRMQGLGPEHTQILINGQPMYSGLAGVYGLQQISTVNVGRIEIIKGAGSALYGSGAIAGAINIITREPSWEPTTNLNVQLGTNKSNRYSLFSSMRNEKGNIGLNIYAQQITEAAIDETGEGDNRDDVMGKDGVSDRVATNLINGGFDLFIDNAILKNDKLILRGKTIVEKRQGGILTDDYYKNPFTDGTENIFTDRYESELNYNKKINSNSEINFSLAYVNHNRDATNDSYLNDYLSTHNDSVPDLREMRPYLANENSFNSILSFATKINNHNLLLGIQGMKNNLNESGMYVVVDTLNSFIGSSYKSTAKKYAEEIAAFIQDEWKVSEKLTFVPGVRIDRHNSGEKYESNKIVFNETSFPETNFKETSINPRAAIKYKISESFTLRANAGSGFRAPYGFSEDLHLCSGSPRVWKSSNLKAETSVSANLSADYYGNNFRTSINLFRTELKNKIGFAEAEADISALGYDYQWYNIDDAVVQGVELTVITTAVKNLNIGLDFTFNDGKYNNAREDWIGTEYESKSKYISRFPITTSNLTIDYEPGKWNFNVALSYQGKMYIDYYNSEIDPLVGDLSKIKTTEPFVLVNARVSHKFKYFKLYGGVNNIFSYIQDERRLDDAAFLYAPVYGRIIYGGISIDIK